MHDSLQSYYGGVLGNYQLSENTAAWATLQSVGLDIISSDELRNAISHLYSVKYVYLENVEKGANDSYQWQTLYPQILDLINIEQIWESAKPVDHEALMNNRKFIETLKMNIFFREYMQSQYESLHDDVATLRNQIEEHIQKLEEGY